MPREAGDRTSPGGVPELFFAEKLGYTDAAAIAAAAELVEYLATFGLELTPRSYLADLLQRTAMLHTDSDCPDRDPPALDVTVSESWPITTIDREASVVSGHLTITRHTDRSSLLTGTIGAPGAGPDNGEHFEFPLSAASTKTVAEFLSMRGAE